MAVSVIINKPIIKYINYGQVDLVFAQC